MRPLAIGLLALACSVQTPPEPTWCVDGATPEELALAQDAIAEWNTRAGAELSIAADCSRRIVVVEHFGAAERLGEWDGQTAWVARPQTGMPEADAVVFRWVVLHELGHAMGLGHSDHEEDAMFEYSTFQRGLTQRDIDALRRIQEGGANQGEQR